MVFNNFKNSLAKYVFLKQKGTPMPTDFYIGFSTTTPNPSGGNITEPSSSFGYSKKKLTLTEPVNGVVSNSSEINYGDATGSWGTITYAVIFDQAGTALFCDEVAQPFSVDTGDLVRIKTGNAKLYFGDAVVLA